MSRSLAMVNLLVIMMVSSGCATSRGVIDVKESEATNPATGIALRLDDVKDARKFEINPRQANIPSLKNDEIHDPAITSRAIARKRNSYGMALGDILLPEGHTVMGLVEDSLTRGLRENGYRVLEAGDTGYEQAIPLSVDIEKFWGWFSPGFWMIGINFEILLRVFGPVDPFIYGMEFNSETTMKFMTAGEENWKTVIRAALDQLNHDMVTELRDLQM